MRFWRTTFWILTLIPIAFIILLVIFYYRAKHVLGFAPSYNLPDPKEIAIYDLHALWIDFSIEIWVYSLLVLPFVIVTYLIAKKKSIDWSPVLFCCIGQLLGFMMCLSGVFEWYVD